jgi:hypothetical protein
VACPVIVGGRRLDFKKHSRTHGAAQENSLMTGVQPRKPPVTNVTATHKTM